MIIKLADEIRDFGARIFPIRGGVQGQKLSMCFVRHGMIADFS